MDFIEKTALANIAADADLVIESLEGGIYLPLVQYNSHRIPISNGNNGFLKFNSFRQAMDELDSYGWNKLFLEQHSAFDEMIGNPIKEQGPLALRLR